VGAPCRGPGPLVSRDPHRRLLRRKWEGLPGSWRDPWAYAVLSDPGRALAPGHCGARVLSPLVKHGRPQRYEPFEALSHGFRPRCLRFAGALTVPPTQDSLPAGGRPLPGGIPTRRVPFRKVSDSAICVYIVFPLPQAWPGALNLAPSHLPGSFARAHRPLRHPRCRRPRSVFRARCRQASRGG
jgi:hypothetical protein